MLEKQSRVCAERRATSATTMRIAPVKHTALHGDVGLDVDDVADLVVDQLARHLVGTDAMDGSRKDESKDGTSDVRGGAKR